MGIEPKIKLNLKALSQNKGQEEKSADIIHKETENLDSAALGDIQSKNISVSKFQKQKETISESEKDSEKTESQKDQEKSHHISFADIKKQIDKKSTPHTGEKKATEENKSDDTHTDISGTEQNQKSDAGNPVLQSEIPQSEKNTEIISRNNLSGETTLAQEESGAAEITAETQKQEEEILDQKNSAGETLPEENTGPQQEEAQKKKGLFGFLRKNKAPENTPENKKIEVNTNIEKSHSEQEEKKEVEKVHFSNYESHFKKESSNFLKKIQNFKYTPSTRVGLVVGLISLTIISIASLMIIFPEKHSLSIYKASILELTNTKTQPGIPQETPDISASDIPTEQKENDIPAPEETELSQEIPEEMIDEISREEITKNKLRQHLLNTYK